MITGDGNLIEVVVTLGVEGRPPDIWLTVGADIVRPVILKLTVDEARELANLLILEANRAREEN